MVELFSILGNHHLQWAPACAGIVHHETNWFTGNSSEISQFPQISMLQNAD